MAEKKPVIGMPLQLLTRHYANICEILPPGLPRESIQQVFAEPELGTFVDIEGVGD
jgi:hypothetical protein